MLTNSTGNCVGLLCGNIKRSPFIQWIVVHHPSTGHKITTI